MAQLASSLPDPHPSLIHLFSAAEVHGDTTVLQTLLRGCSGDAFGLSPQSSHDKAFSPLQIPEQTFTLNEAPREEKKGARLPEDRKFNCEATWLGQRNIRRQRVEQ